jgi:hypothetical protein
VYFSRVSENRISDLIILKKSDLELYRGIVAGFIGKRKE